MLLNMTPRFLAKSEIGMVIIIVQMESEGTEQ